MYSQHTNCPECGSELSAKSVTCGCGWGKSKKQKSDIVEFDKCQDNCSWGDGNQCMYPGSLSHSIRGGGPYFCRFHFFQQDKFTEAQIALESKNKSNREAYYQPKKIIQS